MRRAPIVAALLAFGVGCITPGGGQDYQHNRHDYRAFRARVGSLPEPSYLPWMAHRERLTDGETALVLCRWPDSAFPLRYWIEPPLIPEEVQDEFRQRRPDEYVEAVERAFARWEQEIGRPVRFERADGPDRADVRVHFEARMQVAPEGLFGGRAGDGADLCSVVGPGLSLDRVETRYAVDSVTLYLVDPVGLLTTGQVSRIAMHEIGHVLGASGQHSPLRGDLMYRVADDSRVQELSEHDLNSFRALYRVPAGSVYARLDEAHESPMVEARRGPPRLGSLVEDPRFGLTVRFPRDWQVIRTPRGWIAVDGVSWDYDASIQVIGVRGTVQGMLAQYGPAYLSSGEFVTSDVLEIDERSVPRVFVRRGDTTEVVAFLEWVPGRLLLVIADSRSENFELYRPWFERVLLSLEPAGAETSAGPAAVGAGSKP